MWSGGGDLEGRLFGGSPAPREAARHLWGSGSLSEAAVDLSQARAAQCQSQPQPQPRVSQTNPSPEGKGAELSEIAAPSVVVDEKKPAVTETEDNTVAQLPATTAQLDVREYTSVKEVLLEMTNRKNGHTKLPPARWSIIKKEPDQHSLKVSKYNGDDKKGAFPRPTALVNPFPADIIPLNGGNAQVWVQTKPVDAPARVSDMNKNCVAAKTAKQPLRPKVQKTGNGRPDQSKKKQLNTIVAQLAGSLKGSNVTQLVQADPSILHKLLTPADSVSFLSSHRLSGGEVAVQEQKDRGTEPDLSVVDRLKRLGTVIEVEDLPEPNSLKLLENMTESVSSKPIEDAPKTQLQPVSSKTQLQPVPSMTQLQPVPPKTQLQPVPPKTQLQPVPSKTQLQLVPPKAQLQPVPPKTQLQPILPKTQNQPVPPKIQLQTVPPKTQLQPILPKPQNQPVPPKSNNQQVLTKTQNTPVLKQQPCQQPIPTLYISKDVTLIPKIAQESVPTIHEKLEPSILEPVIDIYEEENILSNDGTFLFKTDSYHNVNLPNAQKVFSCDICSAVYSHSNMLRKHYLRLHISRKYISEKDMETFNIDHENVDEKKKEKLVFRCHTCRECFSNKNDLRSHLTDHPPVDDLIKQTNKTHPTYKCENCSAVFKWRKQFGKHKKGCKPVAPPLPTPPPPPPPLPLPPAIDNKIDLFHCLYCNETFLNANTKRNHILSSHPYVRRKHYCVFCKKDAFTNNINLFSHLITDHPTVYFGCQICKERYTNLEELKSHVNKRHENDERLKLSVMDRTSTIEQEKEFYTCETCQRRFLIENSFKEHVCFPEKVEKPKPKLQKIKKKVYPVSERVEKNLRNVDVETLFYSRVAGNVRDNLLNHLDGKIYKVETSEDDKGEGSDYPSSGQTRTLNFSAGFSSSSELNTDNEGNEIPARSKAQWEKYTFPKNYDGRCGLTSYIKDTSYLDISTQLIMRRNLQRLNMLPMRETQPEDVPSVLALERLGAECAESFGQLKKDKDGEEPPELGSLSGEWVRERMYVCSACRWESPCLWTMEDHKFLSHPRVHCPQHELIGEQAALSKTIYKRLCDVPTPYKGPCPPSPTPLPSVSCTKCLKSGFSGQTELHSHILECAGVVLEPVGPSSSRRRRRRTRRRPRRGLKRNIPSTPQKPPSKPRTKPGDTDTIQRMIANLPPKRVSRKVFSGYEDDKYKNKNKNGNDKNRGKKKTSYGNRSQSEPPTPTKEEGMQAQVMLQKPTVIKKEQDYIDTSAEGGDVLSSLRMMPVRCIKPLNELVGNQVPNESKETSPISQTDEKEMPKLEIEKDLSPVESAEIPVLSPVERKDESKKEKEDLICGISFVDGLIKYETVASVSQETQKLEISRKRKGSSSNNIIINEPKRKKGKQEKPVLTRSQIKGNVNNKSVQKNSKDNETSLINKKENNHKRRGRPKGSLTRKFSSVGSRRSNRISKDNSLLKFDEILPCYEEEMIPKKPEKPKRKPRKSKNDDETIKADSTIIVVKAEIHPEPVFKRKLIEKENNESESNFIETTSKRLKEETDEVKKDSLSDAIDVYTFVEEITEINLISSPSKGSKNETNLKGALKQPNDCLDKNIINHSINKNHEEEEEIQQVDSSIEIDVNNSITELIDPVVSEEVDNVDITDDNRNLITGLEVLSGTVKKVTEENEVTSTSANIMSFNEAPHSLVQSVAEIKSEPIDDTTGDSEENSTMEIEKSNSGTDLINNEDEESSSVKNTEDLSSGTIERAIIKKKKATKKLSKSKKKCTTKTDFSPSQSEVEKKTEKLLITDKVESFEKTLKTKKNKKHLKKDKESSEIELKRPKKMIKKKKVIKKIVKLKKRRPSKSLPEVSSGGEVLKIAGFKWEVSELEAPKIKEEVVLGEEKPTANSQRKETANDCNNSSLTEQPLVVADTETQLSDSAAPSDQPQQEQSSSTTVANWESPTLWESQVPDPSLGTIIDSVNKLLNEPESTYTPLGLPSYSLADLQKAMGASDDEMAVLQQLGEASLQISSSDGSCSISMKSENEEWSNDKCIMDLDTHSTAQPVHSATSNALLEPRSSINQLNHLKDDSDPKDKESTPNSLLAAHQGKEVLCPSCSCHFMGFPALQQHLAKAHPAVGPKAKPKRGGPTSSKIDLSRRMPLDSSQGPRLICFSCQQILPSDRMAIHLEQEHTLPPEDISKCSSLSGETNDGPVIGERLKSKMSSALGDLLDRAVINLLTAKHKPNNTVFRLQGARELFTKFHTQKDSLVEEDIKLATPCKPYSCTICGQKFSLPSSRNKHEVLAHRSFRVSNTPEPYEVEEYDNDWREAPSPPEVNGDNGSENTISPLCSDCGLSFDSIQEMMRHRLEDHTIRRSSVDASTLSGCCPSPVPSSGGSHSLPDSEAEDSSSSSKKRKSTRISRLGSQQGQALTRSVKERAEAALRELNLPRQRSSDKRWVPSCNSKQKADVYSFTDESL